LKTSLTKRFINDSRPKEDENVARNTIRDKIESIVRLQRPYIQNLLRNLASIHPHNAYLICDYILAEELEFNIKESTKEGKIKILVWLSHHSDHRKSFKKMTAHFKT